MDDRGFEVVGISLENPGLRGKETPAETETKLEAAKKKMLDFTVKQEMPWPQYFDGKSWKNEISSKYGINSIPAMWLVNKKGMVVSTNARGGLEEKVGKLLAE